jgi:hypothetical protein
MYIYGSTITTTNLENPVVYKNQNIKSVNTAQGGIDLVKELVSMNSLSETSIEVCPKQCSKDGSISRSFGQCERIDEIVTITNDLGSAASFIISGMVDDDVLIDGQIYQEGQFAFPWSAYGGPCGSTDNSNGAHNFSFSKMLQPGESVKIGGKNNGYGGGITATWTLNACD